MDKHHQARWIIETLANAGYCAYYAGGWVRDFLLGHPSDDIDIATNAPPEIIQSLFPKTVPIGIAFGIILVVVEEGHEYEVATFRNDFDYNDGRRPSRVEFTTAEEDAKRRDFTINGMFYNPLTEEIFDYVEGRQDLKRKIIRAIGNPHERIREDRLRMIRAVRLCCRFQFAIEPATEKAIRDHASELFPSVAIERVVQELEKAHNSRKLKQVLIQLHDFNLLQMIFPELKEIHLDDIKTRLEKIIHFPHQTPLIAFLLELLPNLPIEQQLALCKRLKLSKIETDFAQFLFQTGKMIDQAGSHENVEWAHFYAHSSASLALEVLAAKRADRGQPFIAEHNKRQTSLKIEIERIKTNTPVVSAKELMKYGIKPSISMGLLLKEAEKISINQKISEPDLIISQLQNLPLWPKQ